MTFRIRQIEQTADGRRIVRDRDIADAVLTIGRAAENALHLPDLALEAAHARITVAADGKLEVEAVGTLGFTIDGATSRAARIDPATGAELRFGSHRVAISRDEDGTALLTVQRLDDEGGEGSWDAKRSFTLAGVMPSRRLVSWVLAGLILALFLIVPIAGHLANQGNPKAAIAGDGSWDPGPLSLAHHGLKDQCQACHVKPFEAVRDETCQSCHKTVHDHAAPNRLAGARAAPGLGEGMLQGVASLFGKPGPGSCVACHTEHVGAGRMEPTRQEFCADCHTSLKDRLADTKLANAGDFGTDHPEFRPAIMLDPMDAHPVRTALDSNPREASGLTFPHKVHLDPRGGVARMAITLGQGRGYGAPLGCASCHRPTEDGVRFKPIEMTRDCESCHSLAYDKVGGTFRTLRHGKVDQMVADLSVSEPGAQPIVTGRRRPGAYAAGGTYYANFSLPQAGIGSVERALGRDGVCGECHTAQYRNGKPGVMPVTQPARYMALGWFDHAAHKQEKCESCHNAAQSKSSSDVLLPGIKQCRDCHMGESATKAKVPSSCAMCHSYHPSPLAPPEARDQRRKLSLPGT